MSRRRKKKRGHSEVELNLAAMLDMAFQLLTFFILTFKPAPIEGEIELRMPPPQPVTKMANAKQAGKDPDDKNPLKALETLTISVLSNNSGGIGTMAVGEDPIGPTRLEGKLQEVLRNPANPFEQVIIQVGSGLRYDALMQIIDVCTRQTLADGKKLTKLSFVELPENKG